MPWQVEDPALSLLWLWSLLWCGFDPWLGVAKKKKKKTAKISKKPGHDFNYDSNIVAQLFQESLVLWEV